MGWEYTKKAKATKEKARGERERRERKGQGECVHVLSSYDTVDCLNTYFLSVLHVRKAGKQADQKESTEVFLLLERRRKKRGCLSMSNVYRFFYFFLLFIFNAEYVHFMSTKSTAPVGIKLRWRKGRAGGFFSSLFFLSLFFFVHFHQHNSSHIYISTSLYQPASKQTTHSYHFTRNHFCN